MTHQIFINIPLHAARPKKLELCCHSKTHRWIHADAWWRRVVRRCWGTGYLPEVVGVGHKSLSLKLGSQEDGYFPLPFTSSGSINFPIYTQISLLRLCINTLTLGLHLSIPTAKRVCLLMYYNIHLSIYFHMTRNADACRRVYKLLWR